MQLKMYDLSTAETQKHITFLKSNELAVHTWNPGEPKAVVAYIHGLQSHASWSWEFALDFTKRDIAFVCMDRFGSGLSGGDHQAFPTTERIVSDYKDFFDYVLFNYPNIPVTVVGHCLGGSILTATLSRHRELFARISSISIVSSWLGKIHDSTSDDIIKDIKNESSEELWDVGLNPEYFTHSGDYYNFICQDELAMRAIKKNTRKNILSLEDEYISLKEPFNFSHSQFITSFNDPIIVNERAIKQYHRLYGSTGSVHLLGCDEHYIPFTSFRRELSELIINSLSEL